VDVAQVIRIRRPEKDTPFLSPASNRAKVVGGQDKFNFLGNLGNTHLLL
jgi:hypothetical protein